MMMIERSSQIMIASKRNEDMHQHSNNRRNPPQGTGIRRSRLINGLAAISCCFVLLAGQSVRGSSSQHEIQEEPAHHHPHQQQQQQQSIISSLLANEQHEQSTGGSINLIPVDQPVRSNSNKAEETSQAEHRSHNQVQQATSGSEQVDQRSYSAEQQQEVATQYDGGSDEASVDEIKQQQQQQVYPSSNPQDNQPGQRNGVERRFGLFKNKLGSYEHYGTPQMSANYAYVNDACDRCLASIGHQQSHSADLQDAPAPAPLPLPAPPPPPPPTQTQQIPLPLPVPMPVNQPMSYNQQPQHPLKSKLFMKFPFFMKPSLFGGTGVGDYGHPTAAGYAGNPQSLPLIAGPDYASTYWPHQSSQQLYQASRAPAIYLRPASAYNCIQAPQPLYSGASSNLQQQVEQQHSINILPIGQQSGKSSKSPAASIKQQQQQQHPLSY